MGSQIKRTLIATLIGLAAAIVLAAISSLEAGRLAPIDPLQPLNPGIIGYWVGRLGFIPLIAAIGAMIVGFRKSGAGVTILTFIGALVGIVVVICGLVAVVAAAYPRAEFPLAAPGAARDEYVRAAMGSCLRTQRAAEVNRALSDADIQKYCRCFVEAVAAKTKREDIAYHEKNRALSPAMISLMTEAASTCAQRLRH